MPHTGWRLCGQTTVTLGSTHTDQIICHCLDCKKTSRSAFSTNILTPTKDVKIEGPVKTFGIKAASGNVVMRTFCGNCGSAISHMSAVFCDKQAIQTGNFSDFSRAVISTELFENVRWAGLAPVSGAAQFERMP